MRFLSIAKMSAGLAVVATVLAACVVVEERPIPPPRPDRPPEMCTREYAPVCGVRGRDQRSFGNACMARADGYRIVHPGECRVAERPPRGPVACPMIYQPVCAVSRGDRQTFGNACQAEGEGYRIIHEGECRGGRRG